MTAKNESEARRKTNGLSAMPCSPDNPALNETPGLLRSWFAPAFGISRSHKILSLLSSQRYVLTPDFAIKMLVLFERRKAKADSILKGETGTGKTELLHILSLLINSDSRLLPELETELRNILNRLLEEGILDPTVDAHKTLFSDLYREKTIKGPDGLMKTVVGEIWPQDQAIRFINGILQILEEEDGNAEFLTTVSRFFYHHFRDVYDRYPLLHKSLWMASLFDRADEHFKDNNPEPFVFESTEELSKCIEEFISSSHQNLFACIRMHEGITADEFRSSIRQIVRQAKEANDIGNKLGLSIELIAFVDEANTTSVMGMLKEVFIDHTLDGIELPSNIFWVAAINPASAITGADQPSQVVNYTGLALDTQNLRYIVNPLPLSLEEAVLNYSSLTNAQEFEWIRRFLNDSNLGLATELQMGDMREIITGALQLGIMHSQEFVRCQKINRVEVSIRDMVRCVNLYGFLLRPINRDIFLPTIQGIGIKDPATVDFERCWSAFMIALGLVYYFRLGTVGHRNLRAEYKSMIDQVLRDYNVQISFSETLYMAINKFWRFVQRPPGTAPTVGLKESIFAEVLCMESCIPLIITGPPGIQYFLFSFFFLLSLPERIFNF